MTPSEAVEISKLLKGKGADKPCPRCGSTQFSVLGDMQLHLDAPSDGMVGGLLGSMYKAYVPVAVVGCNNCGFLTTHSISALREPRRGLLG